MKPIKLYTKKSSIKKVSDGKMKESMPLARVKAKSEKREKQANKGKSVLKRKK